MFITGFIVLTIASLFSLVVWWYFIFFKYKQCLKPFCVIPPQFPLLGICYAIRNTTVVYDVMESYRKSGVKNVFFMFGPIPTLCTADSELFSIILRSPKHINKPYLIQHGFKELLGNSLLAANGDEWRQQRKLLNPSLDYANIMANITIFNETSNDLIERLKTEANNKSTEVLHILEDWTLTQTFATLLGDCGSQYYTEETQKAIKLLMKFVIERIISPLTYFTATYVFTKMYWQEKKLIKILHRNVKEILEKKKKEFRDGVTNEKRPIFIDIMINLMTTNDISEDFIIDQITMMIGAAFDTTATVLAYLLYNLAKFPEIQKKAFEEVYSILGDDIQQLITSDHVNELKYVNLVIHESMRLTTTVPVYGRTLDEDVDYGGNILPKGLTILMSPLMMHNDPDLYPEPDEFIPERFLQKNLNLNKYSYTPFNAGIRNCIGQKYALLSLKIVLAKLLVNYEFVDVHHELCFSAEMLLRSKTGIYVGIRNRKHDLTPVNLFANEEIVEPLKNK